MDDVNNLQNGLTPDPEKILTPNPSPKETGASNIMNNLVLRPKILMRRYKLQPYYRGDKRTKEKQPPEV